MSPFIRSVVLSIAAVLLTPLVAIGQEATDWKPVDRSMSALLNDGWRIESMNYGQVFEREFHSASNPANSFQAWALASVPKGLEYNFLLSKSGKWIVCVIIGPAVGDAKSRCRALN